MRLLAFTFFAGIGFVANAAEAPGFDAAARAKMNEKFANDLKACEILLPTAGKEPDLYSKRGDTLLFLGRFKEAVADYEKMIALDPALDAPHWRLGIAYYFIGEYGKSAQQFAKYHAYDPRDRENGIWKFLAQARAEGIEPARREMLVYEQFDREPFPTLYEMLAGKKTVADLFAEIEKKGLTAEKPVSFFGHYYAGLFAELTGDRKGAREYLERAVNGAFSSGAHRDLGYMWQVARLQRELLEKGAGPPPARK